MTALLTAKLSRDRLPHWTAIYDRIAAGEMPPDREEDDSEYDAFVPVLFQQIVAADRAVIAREGRSLWRRLNRFEYENSLRDLLGAPWLQLASKLPEDGELHHFNKVGEALDVSHVNLARYLQAADYALREVLALQPQMPPSTTVRFYAREQSSFNRRVHYTEFNRSPERATFPLIDYDADLRVLEDEATPFTVGSNDPDSREREAFGVVASSYEPIEIRFSSFTAPRSGRYRLRFKGYTFWAAGEEKRPWRPDRTRTSKGRRSEPVAIYSVAQPRQLRRLGGFDFQIEPSVQEIEVDLLAGESIQPDAVRLFRSRPPNWRNPLAEADGMPGVAFSYMEVEGPIIDQWPTAGHKLLFGDLPLMAVGDRFEVVSDEPEADAERLIRSFAQAAFRREPTAGELASLLGVFAVARESDVSFQEAMLTAYTAALCSPGYLFIQEQVGPLDSPAIATRLSLLFWNSLPDEGLLATSWKTDLSRPATMEEMVTRMLGDPRSDRFINAFLDYWLDLRKVNDTSPDELLYPDYYLDDALVDAATEETRLFFKELLCEDLPIRSLVDSDFTFCNERLAVHYALPAQEGIAMRRVGLPAGSPRGGLLTQASILKVTANGSTTSPVTRGVWINERLLGESVPPPPKSVPAIEPDTRGATTIRQQLQLHRADTSCAGCHKKIDPVGFALESFDVVGGWRESYRGLGDIGEPVAGYGKNGQAFTFRAAQPVDPSGELESGERFADIIELKACLVEHERQLAENFLRQFLIYATGAPPRISDRVELRRILDETSSDGYPMATLIRKLLCSPLFLER